MSAENYATAVRETRAVLSTVEPSMHTQPTPCDEWDVKGLIDHLVGAQFFLVSLATGAELDAGDLNDPVSAFDRASAAIAAAFADPSFATREMDLPFGNFTGAQFMDFASLETLAHGWDLAIATGHSTDLAPELSEHLLNVARAMMGDTRPEGNPNFAAEKAANNAATPTDRLAAYLGRTVPADRA
jgi:uncharacterized protein (TIGR03086 family)